jgi:actin-related protein
MKCDANLQKPFHSKIVLENGSLMIKDFPKQIKKEILDLVMNY